ncbi:MAG TPA: lysylphosphatidylglycerol synthase domain-containing protein [Thermomicrobiaceae bacterium]|nr:lysylphosphatidylglycerol synthase domain-containing protein [Thermomicrobiaceae bacterium]
MPSDATENREATPAGAAAAGKPRRPGRWRARRKLGLLLALALIAILGAHLLGANPIRWMVRVANDIRHIPPRYIALACALKAMESLLTAIAWRGVLRAAFPESPVPFRIVLGAYQGGVGINAVTPANAGTWVMIGLYRIGIRGASIASLLAAAVVQGLFFSLLAVAPWVVLVVSDPDVVRTISENLGRFVATLTANPEALGIAAALTLVVLLVLARWLRGRLQSFWRQIVTGGAILRTPRRYLTRVALPEFASYGCRLGYTATFMAAFGIPVTAHTILLVVASSSVVNVVPLTPGGIGSTEAVLVVALRGFASASSVTAFSLAKTSILTICNLLLGFVALTWGFGLARTGRILRHRQRISAETRAQSADH